MFFWKIGLILLGLSLLLGKVSQAKVRKWVRKGREKSFSLDLTGEEFARKLLLAKDVRGVEVIESDAILTDYYDPVTRQIRLSKENFGGKDLAAIAYAAHEVGHAIQHAQNHGPLFWRVSAIRATTFNSMAVLIISLPLVIFPPIGGWTVLTLGAGWGIIRLHNLLTIPVEIDASSRVKDLILNAKILRRSVEMDLLSEILEAVAFDKVAGFDRLWAWGAQRVFPWRRKASA